MNYQSLLKYKALKIGDTYQTRQNILLPKSFLYESRNCQLREKTLRFTHSLEIC